MRDIDIRRALRSEMERAHEGDADTLILDELGLCQGQARVDLAVINGMLHGFEIKSEHDTLARLPSQTDVYNRALDRVTIVTGPSYSEKVQQIVPQWWGVCVAILCGEDIRLECLREPSDNPAIDPLAQAQLLWRDEALDALEERDLASGFRSKSRRALWERLATELQPDELGSVVRERLKRRSTWRAGGQQV